MIVQVIASGAYSWLSPFWIIIIVDRSNHDHACLRSLPKQLANFDISCDDYA